MAAAPAAAAAVAIRAAVAVVVAAVDRPRAARLAPVHVTVAVIAMAVRPVMRRVLAHRGRPAAADVLLLARVRPSAEVSLTR
jgi:hypothetical protein